MRAKFFVQSVTDYGESENVKLTAVTGGSDENESFSKYTPNAMLEISIDNPDARGFFKPNKEYYLDFTEAE